MSRRLAGVVLAMSACAVACAPATFDGLTGGDTPKEAINPHGGEVVIDPELVPPRQVAPISVSWVNTARPKFRWELRGKATGAIIEASQTRDFSGEIRTFPANGSEYSIEEDLPPGMWFWRLRGRIAPTEESAQEVQGPPPDEKSPATVWQVLVRGAGAAGTSDVPNGGIFDLNGDGIPDLATTATVTPGFFSPTPSTPAPTKPVPVVLQWLGQKDGSYQLYSQELAIAVGHSDVSLAGGVDIDGDGFADFASASVWEEPGAPASAWGQALIFHGGAEGMDSEKDGYQGAIAAPWFTKVPKVQAAGDVNGDGYGDLAMVFPDLSYAALGSQRMGATTMMVFPTARELGDAAQVGSPALLTSWDFDNDGKTDIAFGSTLPSTPLAYTRGSNDRFDGFATVTLGDVTPSTAIAIASGDLDGDGKNEFAFTTTIGGKPAVCLYKIDSGPLNGDRCWTGEGPTTDFGKNIVAADLDGDGRDDLVVTTGTGASALKYLGPGSFEATPIPGTFRSSMTVLHPGRPGPARWAIIGGDGKSISIFNGLTVLQKLDVSTDAKVIELGPSIR